MLLSHKNVKSVSYAEIVAVDTFAYAFFTCTKILFASAAVSNSWNSHAWTICLICMHGWT